MAKSSVIRLIVAGLMLTIWGCSNRMHSTAQGASGGNTSASSDNQYLALPASTEIHVTLSSSVQTNENHVGDHFSGVIARSVEENNIVAIPEGATADLVITDLTKGGTLKTPPEIAFTIDHITLADGSAYSVKASKVFHRGTSHTKREVEMIGGGSAAGAVVGGLIGKGKGAVIGGLAGAAAGTGAAAATGRQNIVISSGTTVTFTLEQSLEVAVASR